jgi:hypothetical protein
MAFVLNCVAYCLVCLSIYLLTLAYKTIMETIWPKRSQQ